MPAAALATEFATEFAASPSGYVISVLVGVLVLLVGAQWTTQLRAMARVEKQQIDDKVAIDHKFEVIATALNDTNRALAVVVDHDTTERATVSAHTDKLAELAQTTAMLHDTLDRHERWHERQPGASSA